MDEKNQSLIDYCLVLKGLKLNRKTSKKHKHIIEVLSYLLILEEY